MVHAHWLGEPAWLPPLPLPAPACSSSLGGRDGDGVKEDKDRGTQDGEGCQEALSELHPPRQSPTLSSASVKESVHTHVLVWSGLMPTAGTQAARAQDLGTGAWRSGMRYKVSSRCSVPRWLPALCLPTVSPSNSNTHLGQRSPVLQVSLLPSWLLPGLLQAPVLGLAGESFYLPFLRGLLPLHLFQLAWLCLNSYSPHGPMPAVCTPPPGSCIFYHQQLEQKYLAYSFRTLSSHSARHQSTDPRDNPRGGPQSFTGPIPTNKALACSHG